MRDRPAYDYLDKVVNRFLDQAPTADLWPEHLRGDAYEGPVDPPPEVLPIVTCADLLRTYPERRPAVITGLLRRGETMNLIASPKVGKSWLALLLAFAVATGRLWLGTFGTTRGRVLLIDNELHPETSAHRLWTLAQALELPMDAIGEAVQVVNLRGRLRDLIGLGSGLRKIERGRFVLVIIDAFYRTVPAGTDENDNAGMASLYNELDCYAESLGAAFALVHHASKGDQSGKAVTDVGAGAGAQSRACDTHLILRPHEEENVVVMDAAVRSWEPVKPRCLRWAFPVWSPAHELDPADLRVGKPRKAKGAEERPPKGEPDPPWTARRFADTFGRPEPRPRAAVLEAARNCGLSDHKARTLLSAALGCELLFSWKEGGASSRTLVATVKPPEMTPPPDQKKGSREGPKA
jgi:hypothetical protein